MAYLFGAAGSNVIDFGTGITHAATYSLFVRFAPTSSNSSTRLLFKFGEDAGTGVDLQVYMTTSNGVTTNCANTVPVEAFHTDWAGALTAGVITTLVITNDGSTVRVYSGADATPKVTDTSIGFPPPQNAGQHFRLGNNEGGALSADATVYEVGWWPGTVLTGAQAAALGGGGPVTGVPAPTFYWPLISDAVALYGGQNGTVTGASVVAHSGTNAFPSPAYVFGAGVTDKIETDTSVAKASTWSLAARFKITAANTTDRVIATVRDATTGVNAQLNFSSGSGTNHLALFMSKAAFTAFPATGYASGFTAGSTHVAVGTYDGTSLKLYADLDATPKAALADAGPPDQPAGAVMAMGNDMAGGATLSLDGTLYEVAWYPDVVLTGAQAALLGGGGPMPVGFPLPAHYWPLTANADDFYGSADGVVTGTTSGALVGTSWFPLAAGAAMNILLLQPSAGGRGD